MQNHLVFRLYGPMASWGQAAVGGDRPTDRHPSRSAVLGLLSAALGIKRDEDDKLRALGDSVHIAVKHCAPTSLLRDYHTAQVPSHNKKVVHRSRKSELNETGLNTILSSRDYRCDGLWTIALTATAAAPYSLEQIKSALEKPVFTLYLGRKSCPLAAPLKPQLVTGRLQEALDTNFPELMHKGNHTIWLHSGGSATYLWEGDRNALEGEVLTTHPWDEPMSRTRWQFKQRVQYQTTRGS
jgi:CRISPR system Cascade subunit CasD